MGGWNRCGFLSDKPAGDMTLKEARSEVMKMRLRLITLYREIDRGRPLTAVEQVANLEAGLELKAGRLASIFNER